MVARMQSIYLLSCLEKAVETKDPVTVFTAGGFAFEGRVKFANDLVVVLEISVNDDVTLEARFIVGVQGRRGKDV